MSDEQRAAQRWHTEGRTAQTLFGGLLVVLGLYQALTNLGAGMSGAALFHGATVLTGLVVVALVRSTYVEADGRGLRIARPPRNDRVIAWHDIVDVRREPPNTYSSKLGVVLRDGEVVDLRVSVDVRRELVERWRLETR